MHTTPIHAGDPSAPRRVVIIHGYTGSPDEFRDFAEDLARRIDAYVTAPILPGHGTHEDALSNLSFDDLLEATLEHVREAHAEGKPTAIVGHSFGGFLALLAAEAFPMRAIALTVIPYVLRFPFSLPGTAALMNIKQHWHKKLSTQEIEDRKGKFYYPRMPGKSLALVHEGVRRIRRVLPRITAPIFTIHGHLDSLAIPQSGEILIAHSGGHTQSKSVVLENAAHGIFFGSGRGDVQDLLLQFFESEMVGE